MKLLLAAVAALLVPAAAAAAKPAHCTIAAGEPEFRGPCRFIAEGKGSFSIIPLRARSFSTVSVSILRPGVAEVRGLTADGINSRWGEARRSRRDRACWVGSDFRICVYRQN
jgi:hypothetical protein